MTPVAWTPDLERIARRCIVGYFLRGDLGDRSDVLQEARIGVWKATQTWDPARGGFDSFARLCGTRAVQTAVKLANARKHEHINGAASLDAELARDTDATLADVVADTAAGPLEHVLALEDLAELADRFATLSPLEREAFVRVALDGEPYDAVGDPKAIDNALQRARHKLRTGRSRRAPAGRPPAPRDRRRCADCHRPWLDTNPDRADVCPFCAGPAYQPGMMPRDGRPNRTPAPRGAAA